MSYQDIIKYNSDFLFYLNHQKKNHFLFIIIVMIFISSFLLWASFTFVNITIHSIATIRPFNYISVIKSPVSGSIEQKNYQQGKKIRKGDVLLLIDYSYLQTKYTLLEHQLLKIEEDLNGLLLYQKAITDNNRIYLTGKYAERFQVFYNQKRKIEIEYQKSCILLKRETDQPSLYSIPSKIQDLTFEAELNKADLLSVLPNELLKIESEKELLINQKLTLTNELTDLSDMISKSILIAPIDGTIEEINQYNIGDYLFQGDSIINIIPTQSNMVRADLIVPSSSILLLKLGMNVNFMISNQQYFKKIYCTGIIESISGDTVQLSDNRKGYKIEVLLDTNDIMLNDDEVLLLKPGMQMDAVIPLTKKRTLWFILEKLLF